MTVVSSLFLKHPHDISHFHAYVEVLYSIESSLCVHLSHCIHDSAGVATTAFAQAIVVGMRLVILVDRVFRHCQALWMMKLEITECLFVHSVI